MKSRVKDILLSFNKNVRGFKPFEQVHKQYNYIRQTLEEVGPITIQLNVDFVVSFPDNPTDVFHIISDKSHILINDKPESKTMISNHIKDIKDKYETRQFKKKVEHH